MIAAEEWYAYQKQYQKYGLDMKPEEELVSQRERRKQERAAARARGMALKLGSDHKVMLGVVVAVAADSIVAAASVERVVAKIGTQAGNMFDVIVARAAINFGIFGALCFS